MEHGVMTSDVIPLYCDNNGVIVLAKESRFYQKLKHIEQQFHIIWNYLEKKYIEMQRIDFIDNLIDPLTKQLSQPKIEVHLERIGLRLVAN